MTYQKLKTKNGGPYTKTEQEERRNKVYELYFEKGLPAIKIADELGVNRNTVNSDIQTLLAHSSARLGEYKVTGTILTEIQRLEVQRKRLLNWISPKDFKKTIAAEKVILQIEKEICSIMAKMGGSTILDRFGAVEGVTEDEISDFVRETLFSGGLPCIMKPRDLVEKITSYQKCDQKQAEAVRKKMQSFGMKQMDGRVLSMYNLHEFALLRNYISPEENSKLQENKNIEELEKKFLEEYDEKL